LIFASAANGRLAQMAGKDKQNPETSLNSQATLPGKNVIRGFGD